MHAGLKVIQITNTYQGKVLDIVASCVPTGFTIRTLPENSEQALLDCVGDADYILASGRVRISAAVLDAAPHLKMIQRTGVGLDSLDLDELSRRSIPLYVNKGVNAESVAEHTVLLMLASMRRLCEITSALRNGRWDKQGQGIRTYEIAGKTVGLIGIGSIGRRVAELLRPFGAHILYYDKYRLSPEQEEMLGVQYAETDTLLAAADIISLHCPLTDETRGMINHSAIARMKNGSVLINTARGSLVCQADLVAALKRGKLGGAGLDVFESEPLSSDSPLLSISAVTATPHIGGVTYDSFRGMMTAAMENIRCFDAGMLDEIAGSRFI